MSAAGRCVRVWDPGPRTLVQDEGRPGLAHLGVPRSGWLDAPAARLANRLVGNDEGAAVLECLLGGLVATVGSAMAVAVTGPPCPVRVEGRAAAHGAPLALRAGAEIRLGRPAWGARCYVAFAGGLDVSPVLGSRATDTLSGLGPAPVTAGSVLPIAGAMRPPAPVDLTAPARRQGQDRDPDAEGRTLLRVHLGPRADWFGPDAARRLAASAYTVAPDSDRVGLRLAGTALPRGGSTAAELPSEGLVLGAVQVPADGRPVVFLHDHPTTGGYPVIAVVDPGDLGRCAQLLPGDAVLLRIIPPPAPARG